ncbi:MAG: tRNA 2-thiouridine(34) synthase MnmA [Flavobacteriales bacterium]|nr:tRNA 2-thiouridine(34) synthase MnmA [Flavobacteriales bacterium]
MARVVVGLSGGVDSSVAAHLLIEEGHEVIGLFMRNWHDDSVIIDEECPWIEDSNDALLVAEKLGIPFQVIDLSDQYKERIVDYMFSEYEAGRTPNPDVLCNREIKFDVFLEAAMELGADYVATGHYCRKETVEVEGQPVHRLLAGKDPGKDQSYFLCQVNQEQLSKALFPIGELLKSEVRAIAKQQDLATFDKKDSQGLCFIGKVRLPDFLQQKLAPKTGDVIEIPSDFEPYTTAKNGIEEMAREYTYSPEDGKCVGQHQGAHYFTIGQRKGLGIGGTKFPLFIVGTNVDTNTIYVGQGEDHPGLRRNALLIDKDECHWIRKDLEMAIDDESNFLVRIRYRQALFNAKLVRKEEGIYVISEEPMKAIAAGQFAAWYLDDELIGSGVIQ